MSSIELDKLINQSIKEKKVVFVTLKLDGLRDVLHFTVLNKNGRVADCGPDHLEHFIIKGLTEELE